MKKLILIGLLLVFTAYTEQRVLADTKQEQLNRDLFIAIDNNNLQDIQKLIEEGADANYAGDQYHSTALIIASITGHLEIVEFLVKKGANVNIQNKLNQTALMMASANGHLEIVTFLVKDEKAKANVNIKDSDGWTALMLASWRGYLNIVEFLVEEGNANVNIKDNSGETALTLVSSKASSKRHKEVVDYLKSKGAR